MYSNPPNAFNPRYPQPFQEKLPSDNFSWGINRGSLPMHSPVWVPDRNKSWLHSLSATAVSLYYLGYNHAQRYLRISQKRAGRFSLSSSSSSLTSSPPASSNLVFVLLCGLWYTSSALSSNTGKAIMTQFRYPVTLTFIQFGFVGFYCLLFMSPVIRFSRLRMPTKAIIQTTLPMGMFQVGGHMFSSIAISRIPVSTVHTIKALSPLFTVAAYALLFGVSYSTKTYISLLPLTVGVMLACSFDVSASNAVGLLCAFGSALVFVSSNIFFKKVMPSKSAGATHHSAHKLDKLNLLLYSSMMAFLLMIPLWLYYDLPVFLSAYRNPEYVSHPSNGHSSPHSVTYYFFTNGTVHFAQNIIAFVILSSTSPVTYSIASLIKRVVVICIAIVWFSQSVHPIQAVGITMTFVGLYMYNTAKSDVEKGEKKMRRVEAARDLLLPSTVEESQLTSDNGLSQTYVAQQATEATGTAIGASTYGRSRRISNANALQQSHPRHPRTPLTSTGNNRFADIIPLNTSILLNKDGHLTSPVDSYPSPPASIDSPPPMEKMALHQFGSHPHPSVVAV